MNDDYNIAWEVTNGCNHNCFYCYNYYKVNNCLEEISDESYEKISDYLVSLHPLSVAITGGEPLLVFDKIKNSIKKFSQSGIFVRLLTNGSLITDCIASFLKDHNVQIMVSFPVAEKDTFNSITNADTYSDVINCLDILQKNGCDVTINMVVNASNLHLIDKTTEFLLQRYNYELLYYSRATKPNGIEQDKISGLLNYKQLQVFIDKCVEIKEKHKIDVRTCGGYAYCAIQNPKAFSIFAKGCGGGHNSFVISNSGDIRICGKDLQVFGNVFCEDIKEIISKAQFWTSNSAIPKECKNCKFNLYCRGGCHMSSLEKFPKYNSLDGNANPQELNPNFKFSKKRQNISLFKKYRLNSNVNYYHKDNKVRLSYRFLCVYVSQKIAKKIQIENGISLFDIIILSCFSINKSKSIMSKLIDCKIVV